MVRTLPLPGHLPRAMIDLEKRGLLERMKIGKQFAWVPRRDMLKALEEVASGSRVDDSPR